MCVQNIVNLATIQNLEVSLEALGIIIILNIPRELQSVIIFKPYNVIGISIFILRHTMQTVQLACCMMGLSSVR